jgi:hypothetical protein
VQNVEGRSLKMMKEMAQIRGLARENGDELAFVVNHSGEKDSARMLGLVCKEFLRKRRAANRRVPEATSVTKVDHADIRRY